MCADELGIDSRPGTERFVGGAIPDVDLRQPPREHLGDTGDLLHHGEDVVAHPPRMRIADGGDLHDLVSELNQPLRVGASLGLVRVK